MKQLLMGNEAVALGALAAGVRVVAGYPGTPSTETLETVAKRNPGGVYVEWSVNEKAAAEIAVGAAYAGARSLVTMKQVGLNVASDPIMCVNYMGVKAGMVIYVADDPGPISSQTEQDTRHFGKYARIPIFDCSSPEEAFQMTRDAFDFSEAHGTPVILRSTTRVCHSCAVVDVPELAAPAPVPGFVKDSRWVIFPRLSYENKKKLVAREKTFAAELDRYEGNTLTGGGSIGIVCGGVSYAYVMEAIQGRENLFTVLKIATPYPFPTGLGEKFIRSVEQAVVFEELDPVLEDALIYLCGQKGLRLRLNGKHTGDVSEVGELSAAAVAFTLSKLYDLPSPIHPSTYAEAPKLPMRPPALCAGCPHRASFYAVKRAMAGKKAIFCGDIGCYTLGNAAPLDMVDTCLCMGAGITIAQGLNHADPQTVNFAFVGDSTFFASGVTGVINAVYNKADMVLVVLDNSTTAMTGHQPHPGIGKTMMNQITHAVSIEDTLRGVGVGDLQIVDPLDLKAAVAAVQAAAQGTGVRAIIFRSPCIAVVKRSNALKVNETKCIGCGKCLNALGCPALSLRDGKANIDDSLCVGCDLCAQVCPLSCIGKEEA